MNHSEMPPENELAFHSADKTRIRQAVIAAIKELGLDHGSVCASSNKYKSYDLYKLLGAYINDPQKRLEIHRILGILD